VDARTTPSWTGDASAPRPGRSRRPLVAGGLALLLAAAGLGTALALRGGDASPTADDAGGSPSAGTAASIGSPTSYDQLLEHIPAEIRSGCRDQTSELDAQSAAAVLVRAGCSSSVGEQGVQVLYDVVRGDTSVATDYRRSVLGIGGGNHAPGNCQTRMRDPQFQDRSAKVGLYMPAGTTGLDVESWCDYSGHMYLLQPDPTNAVFVSLQFDDDDGDISRQGDRYDALLAVRPT
jgi:hypothetical protein